MSTGSKPDGDIIFIREHLTKKNFLSDKTHFLSIFG